MVYNSEKDTITGDKLFVFIGGKPIAFGTSCALDISADSIDTANKMSGAWKSSLAGQLGFSLSSDSLMSKKSGHMSFDTLLDLMVKREAIEFVFGKAKDVENADFDLGESWYKGTAFITALNLKADNGAVCTSSITLTGSGALAKDSTGGVSAPTNGGSRSENNGSGSTGGDVIDEDA